MHNFDSGVFKGPAHQYVSLISRHAHSFSCILSDSCLHFNAAEAIGNSIVVFKALKCGVYKFLQHNGDKSVRITVEELSSFEHFSVEGAAPLKFIDCLSDLNSTKSKKIMQNYAKI